MAVPNTFSPSTPARSSKVNENFEYLSDRVANVYQSASQTTASISAGTGSAWTDATGASLSISLDTTSTIYFILNWSVQNNSVQSSAGFRVWNSTDSQASTGAGQDIGVIGYKTEACAVVVMHNVTAGNKTMQMQFVSANTTTFTSTTSTFGGDGTRVQVLSIVPTT